MAVANPVQMVNGIIMDNLRAKWLIFFRVCQSAIDSFEGYFGRGWP